MIAEILAVGTEIVSGAKLDTNSQWLSLELGQLGIPVQFHTSVGDDLEANVAAMRTVVGRSDLVIITGGLGPTLDDLTRDALARLAGVPLILDEALLLTIQEMFRTRGRPMPDRNRVQAEFPAGSQPLPNLIGTAPGIWMEFPRSGGSVCLIAALPGVPSEMKRMFREQVVPRLPSTGLFIRRQMIHCYGCGESQAEELLGDLTARGRDPEIGITAHEATITLRIEARGNSETVCAQKLQVATCAIRQRLGRFVFGEGDEELEDVVLHELSRRAESLCVVDCGSRGWLGRTLSLARVVSEKTFRGSLMTNRLAEAARWLGLEVGCGGPGVHLEAVAATARRLNQTTYAVAVGELPDVAVDELARGSWRSEIVLCGPGPMTKTTVALGDNPAILSARLGKTALDLLRLEITSPDRADSADLAPRPQASRPT